jgi:hypothetical protein
VSGTNLLGIISVTNTNPIQIEIGAVTDNLVG